MLRHRYGHGSTGLTAEGKTSLKARAIAYAERLRKRGNEPKPKVKCVVFRPRARTRQEHLARRRQLAAAKAHRNQEVARRMEAVQ